MKHKITTAVIGSYPVTIDTMTLMNQYFSEQEIAWESTIQHAVQDMVTAGIDLVSDGQTRDPFIQLFTRKIKGCRIRDRTEIIEHVEYNGPITVPDQKFTRSLLPRKTKLVGVLTGPFTLTKSCVDLFYHDEKQLCFDFAAVLRKEAEHLQKHVDLISIDEPFFANEMPDYAKELIGTITKNLSIPTRLHACGDVSKIIPQLVDLPVDILSHEFKASPFLFDSFKEYSCTKKICIGAVRSDDMRVEPVQEIVSHINKALDLFGENVVQIAPDCGQRLLPRNSAYNKLQNLAAAGGIINGG
jgi:5-methyltetrahydropteroyltriglutamate--homocysteine methyltransferase